MKKKKQMKIILASIAVLAIALGGWLLMKPRGLSAEEAQKPREEETGENVIPKPPNPNAINVQENFTFLGDSEMVGNWTNTVRIFPDKPGSIGALWYNEKISLKEDFQGDFAIYFGDLNARAYDGVTLTFQNSPREKEAIGGPGAKFGNNASDIAYPPTIDPKEPGIARGVSIAITPGIKANVLPGHTGAPTVSVAIPKAELASGVYAYSLLYWPESYGKDLSCSNYNIQPLKSGWLNNGKWLKVSFKWEKSQQKLSYRLGQLLNDDEQSQIPNEFNFSDPGWQSFQFGTGATSLEKSYLPTDNSTGSKITEFVGKTAEEYFGGDTIYWGFAGSNVNKGYYENENGQLIPPEKLSINPVISIGQTPNQSQSPLQLSMTKLGEIDTETGKRAPLEGAEFILQTQDAADGRWRQFNPGNVIKDPNDLIFTTGEDGKIVIKATDNQKHADLIDLVLQYGGTYNGEPATEEHPSNYAAFRFREVKEAPNPDGDAYIAPPAIDPKDPTNYAASEPANSAALFATKSVKLSGSSTTPTDPTEENPDDGDFGTVYNSNQNWLPYYQPNPAQEGKIGSGGWLDSMTSYIPKGNAFVPMYIKDKTILNKEQSSPGIQSVWGEKGVNDNKIVENSQFFPNDKGEQWLAFENVGYKNGTPINLKVIVSPHLGNGTENSQFKQYIGTTDGEFLAVLGNRETDFIDVSFRFFNEKWEEISTTNGHWEFVGISNTKDIEFSKDIFENIYSVTREFSVNNKIYPILIKYNDDDSDKKLNLSNKEIAGTGKQWQTQTTITYNEQKDISLRMIRKENYGYRLGFSHDSLVKVEFPDPQVTKTDYTEIIGDGKGVVGSGEDAEIEDFSFQFVQQVPWESAEPKNNRTQFPTWNVKASVTGGTVAPTEEAGEQKPWTVIALDDPYDPNNTTNPGLDAKTLFDFSGDKITPKGSLLTDPEGKPTGINSEVIDGDKFYNHYYSFQKEVSINYKADPISAAALQERPKTETEIFKPFGYFDFSGSVNLDVVDVDATPEQKAGMNKDRDKVDVSYHTQMNFLAKKVDYVYVDQAVYDKELEGKPNPTEEEKAAAIETATISIANLPDELKEKDKDNKDVLKTGQAIVTWQVPLTPTTYTKDNLATTTGNAAPKIDGYEYVENSATLNGTNDLQVKVTQLLNDGVKEDEATADDYKKNNEVILFYSPNELTLTCDGNINFAEPDGPTSVPFKTGANQTIPRATNSVDWKVYVTGGFPSGKTGYNVKANYVVKKVGEDANENDVPQIFQNNNGDTLPANILEFKNTSTDTPVTIGVGEAEAKTLFSSNETLPDGKSWGADAGFSLNLSYLDSAMIALRLPKGSTVTYTAEIELSLEMTP